MSDAFLRHRCGKPPPADHAFWHGEGVTRQRILQIYSIHYLHLTFLFIVSSWTKRISRKTEDLEDPLIFNEHVHAQAYTWAYRHALIQV